MQILTFSNQKSSTTIIYVSYGEKVAIALVLCICEIQMASKMAAKIIKMIFLAKYQLFFAVL